jgi:hypothetical protein
MGERYEAERKKRQSRDAELREAEETIEQLQLHLNQLEDIMDGKSKRVLPARTQEDSPELHAAKKTRTEAETLTLGTGILNEPVFNEPVLNQPVFNEPVLNQPVLNQPVLNQPVLNQGGNLLDAPGSAKDAAPQSESSRSSSISSRSTRSSSKDPSSDSTASNKTRTHTYRPTDEERAVRDNTGQPLRSEGSIGIFHCAHRK